MRTNYDSMEAKYHLNERALLPEMQGCTRDIYIVDDNLDDLFFSSRTLMDSSFVRSVHEVSNAENLFNIMKEHGHFDDVANAFTLSPIIFLDVHMPNLNGINMLELIKDHPMTSELIVILLTADMSGDKIHDAYRLKANGYLEKPFKLEKFHKILDDIEKGDMSFKAEGHYLT